MTTLAIVRKENRFAIGADTMCKDGYTLVSSDYRIGDNKITKIGNSYMGSTGFCGWNLVLRDYFDSLDSVPELGSVTEIFKTISQLHESLKDDYFLNASAREHDAFERSHFSCLVANPNGTFGFFTKRNVIEYSRFYAIGSGYEYALGAMRAIYDSTATVEEIVREGLEAAADFDENTSTPFEIFSGDLTGTNQ